MSVLEFRPRFRFRSPLSGDLVMQRIELHVRSGAAKGIRIRTSRRQLTLKFDEKLRHAWTPQMDVSLDEEEGETVVRCLIGPAPNIWMLFTGGYIFWTFVALVGIALGVSQQTVGETAWGYWLLIPALIGSISMIFIAEAGKRRSRDEMRALKKTVDDALGCDCFKLSQEQE